MAMQWIRDREFWADAAERMIATAVQVMIPAIAAGIAGIDWVVLGLMVLSAVVLSFLKAVAKAVGAKDEAEADAGESVVDGE